MSITRFSLHQQWGHIASELERAIHRLSMNDQKSYSNSLERILVMIDEMTPQHYGRHSLKELMRFKEFLLENYTNQPSTTQNMSQLKDYAYSFILH